MYKLKNVNGKVNCLLRTGKDFVKNNISVSAAQHIIDTGKMVESENPDYPMSGIFMWLIRGYIRYKERGLTMSEELRKVVKKYENDNDIVLQFLEARCERFENADEYGTKESRVLIKAKDLYQAFKIWAKSEGAYVLSARKFNAEMERHPEWFDRKSTSSGFVIYWGVKLKEVL